MTAHVTDRDNGYRELVRRLYGLKRRTVEFGVLSPKAEEVEGTDGKRPVTVLDVAIWQHFGTSRIPARPFLTGWLDTHEREVRAKLVELMREAVRGRITPEQALERLGLWCVGEVQKYMAEGVPPPLAASTIARRGPGKPLINTGQLRSSLTHRVDGGHAK